jgi:acyl-coenzyme A thioesterase PaaI-like protein
MPEDMPTKQPNSRYCFVCGVENPYGLKLKFYATAEGEVTSWYTVAELYQGYPGVVHGGIVAAMLDEVTGRVLMGSGEKPRFMFTARLEIRYRKNVPVGVPLRLVGRVIKNKIHSALATGAIYDPEDALLAEAEIVLVNVPPEMIESTKLEDLGWKVYPD